MAFYTVNYCVNPAFQLGLQGYSAINGAALALDTTRPLYGSQSLLVQTPGFAAGEGVITAQGLIPSAATCSASVFIQGSGTVNINAVLNPGGIIVGSSSLTLTSNWQRAILGNLNVLPGQSLYLIVQTTSSQIASFWINGCQIEPESPPHPYCDGDQVGCFWQSGSEGGVSFQPFQNPVTAITNIVSATNVVQPLVIGEVFNASTLVSSSSLSDNIVFTTIPGPVGALSDFGVFQLTDPDPAQMYAGYSNSGSAPGTGGSYNRVWATFYAPLDYFVSSGFLYNRAAYIGAGFAVENVPNNGSLNIANVQVELLPVTTGYSAPSPTAYDTPRSVHTIIKPTRLNFCPNPSIEVSTSGWTPVGTAILSQDSTTFVSTVTTVDDVNFTPGTKSLKVIVNAAGDGAQISIPDLIAGDTYVVSAYVRVNSGTPGSGFSNITMICSGATTSVLSTGGIGFGSGDYGVDPYGGFVPGQDLSAGIWFRINTIFTAQDSTVTLSFSSNVSGDVVYPAVFWIDAVMVESGELLGAYFDGSYGTNYFWETGGTAGLTRSYYYDQWKTKKQAVLNVLNRHLPLGISFATPLYNITYTQ